MPRKEIELSCQVERLSILDQDGQVDEELLPDLPEDVLKELHRAMLRGRRFDEKRLQLQRQGRIGTFAPCKGQEASQVGAVAAMEEEDWMVPSFREATASLYRGTPLPGLLLYDAGYNEGGRIPDEINDLPIAVPVGTQIPHATGLAYGLRLRKRSGNEDGDSPPVVLTFFGDGATSEGDFHEALNWAQILKAPVVFVCQNNQWAISVPRDRQTRSETLAQKALAYGMPGLQVDGNDVFAVYSGVKEAVDRAREGEGPTLVECVTYRLSLHTTADDPKRYRSEEEVEKWEARDPIQRFQDYLLEKGVLEEEDVEALEEALDREMEEAWDETRKMMEESEGPEAMFDHVYARRPGYLEAQRETFLEQRGAESRIGRDGDSKGSGAKAKGRSTEAAKKSEGEKDGPEDGEDGEEEESHE